MNRTKKKKKEFQDFCSNSVVALLLLLLLRGGGWVGGGGGGQPCIGRTYFALGVDDKKVVNVLFCFLLNRPHLGLCEQFFDA